MKFLSAGVGTRLKRESAEDKQPAASEKRLTQLLPAGDIDDHGKLRSLIFQAID